MRCIFCKNDSTNSISIEHIIPESLGNVDHVLPRGAVCDACNNYISREVEKPFLDLPYIKGCRFDANIQSKKKRIPPLLGYHKQSQTPIQFIKKPDESGTGICSLYEADGLRWRKSMRKNKTGTLIVPIWPKPSANDYDVSRFVAKVGLEVLAFRLIDNANISQSLDEIIDKVELDELRAYVRRGSPGKIWSCSRREIYPPDFAFHDGEQSYTIPHEFGILVTDGNEYYIVLAIFGDEYVLNLGGREIDGYEKWLRDNQNKSPLYFGKNA